MRVRKQARMVEYTACADRVRPQAGGLTASWAVGDRSDRASAGTHY